MIAFSGVRISWLILARSSDLADDAFSAWRLRRQQVRLDLLPGRDVAEHRAQLVGVLADPSDGHEQRDQSALAHAADHLAAAVEHARDAVFAHAVEIVDRDVDALRREQIEERPAGEFAGVVAEQRLGAAVGRDDRPGAVEHDDAVGGGVEDRVKLGDFGARAGGVRVRLCRVGLGLCGEDLGLLRFGLRLGGGELCGRNFLKVERKFGSLGLGCRRWRRDQQGVRGLALPQHRNELGLDAILSAAIDDRQGAWLAGRSFESNCCRGRSEGRRGHPLR